MNLDPQKPKVSVIIPFYNSETIFEKCIRSLFEQTLEDLEFIFVNDNSLDHSLGLIFNVLESYPNRKSQVTIITHDRNLGSGRSRKDGMLAATGDYVIHCDSDDWVDKEMYETLYKIAKEEDADIVCSGFYREFSSTQIIELYPSDYSIDKDMMKKGPYWRVLYSSMWSKLVKRSLYVDFEVYPFEGINMWEDLGVMTRLRFFSKKTIIVNKPFYHYNQSNENSLASKSSLSKVKEQISCAEALEKFFLNRNELENYKIFIQSIKFSAKERLFSDYRIRNIKKWRTIFPETHNNVLKYIDLPINMRMIYILVICGFSTLSCFIYDKKKYLRK